MGRSLAPFLGPLLLLAVGCAERTHPPGVVIDGDVGIVDPPPMMRRDGGGSRDGAAPADADTDGGPVDASRPSWCVEVGPGSDPNTLAASYASGEPFPFPLSTAFATWDSGRCTAPTLLVGLSDGPCLPANGQQLLFAIDRDAIEAMIVRVGAIAIDPETGIDDPITVRLFAPRAGGAVDEWGTCAGSTGLMTFDDVGAVVGARLRASFTLTLTDCREPIDQPPLDVSGTFDLTITVPFEDVCL